MEAFEGLAPVDRGLGLVLEGRRMAVLVRTVPPGVRPVFVGLAPMGHPARVHASADHALKARRATTLVREAHALRGCPARHRASAGLAPKGLGTVRH